jgi:replicative DNA helicase
MPAELHIFGQTGQSAPAVAGALNGSLPPHSEDAERGLLGSMIRDNATIGDVLNTLRDERNFYKDAHQRIFAAVRCLYERNAPIDLVTLAEELAGSRHIQAIGGYDYLARLVHDCPTAANAEYYAKIVREKSILRELILAGHEIIRSANHPSGPADGILESCESRIFEIAEWGVVGNYVPIDQALQEAFDRLDQRVLRDSDSSVSGLSTNYLDLDKITAGLQESELVIVAARPSVGKTAFALNLMRNIAVEEGHPVFFVSLEQSRIELAERLLAAQARVDSHRLRVGRISQDDQRAIIAASNPLNEAKIFIDDSPGQNMLRIAANARRLKHKHNIKAVFVDYLQLVEPDPRQDNRQEQVATISRKLKFLAKELRIPVVACAQLNRGVEMRAEGEPKLSDLRESGSIEQDADTVMLLNRPKDKNTGQEIEGVLEIIVAKQRNGPTGRLALAHLKQFMRFENYAGQWPPP